MIVPNKIQVLPFSDSVPKSKWTGRNRERIGRDVRKLPRMGQKRVELAAVRFACSARRCAVTANRLRRRVDGKSIICAQRPPRVLKGPFLRPGPATPRTCCAGDTSLLEIYDTIVVCTKWSLYSTGKCESDIPARYRKPAL